MNKSKLISMRARGAVLALAFALMSDLAAAQGIVYFVPQDVIGYGPVTISNNLDLNNDGIIDFILTSDISGAWLTAPNDNFLITGPGGLVPVTPGSIISSNGSSLDPIYQWNSGRATLGGQAVFDGEYFYAEIFQIQTRSSACNFSSRTKFTLVGWKFIITPMLLLDKFWLGLMKVHPTLLSQRVQCLNPAQFVCCFWQAVHFIFCAVDESNSANRHKHNGTRLACRRWRAISGASQY